MNTGRKLHLLRPILQIPTNMRLNHFWWNEIPWHSFFRSLFEYFLISFKKLVDLSRSTLLGFSHVETYGERFETRLWRSFYDVNLRLFLHLQRFQRKTRRDTKIHTVYLWSDFADVFFKGKAEEFECFTCWWLETERRRWNTSVFLSPLDSWTLTVSIGILFTACSLIWCWIRNPRVLDLIESNSELFLLQVSLRILWSFDFPSSLLQTSSCDRVLRSNCRKRISGSMMKITQVITENLIEFEPFCWIERIVASIFGNFRWFLSVFVMNLVQLCVFLVNLKRLRWFQWRREFVRTLVWWRVKKRTVSVFDELASLEWWLFWPFYLSWHCFIGAKCSFCPMKCWHVPWTKFGLKWTMD
jgi:hypothetical protein